MAGGELDPPLPERLELGGSGSSAQHLASTARVHTSWWHDLPMPAGFGFPAGFGAGIVATLVAVAAGATRHPDWLVVALVLVVTAVATVSTAPAALGTAATSWCLLDVFLLGRHGQLVFTMAAGLDAVILTLVALGGPAVAATVRTMWKASSCERGRLDARRARRR